MGPLIFKGIILLMVISVEKILSGSGIGVLPTDTIYGLAGRAMDKKAVEKIYKIRKRNPKKPLIILINSLNDLPLFRIKLSLETKKVLKKVWPGPVSVILPCRNKKFHYLHRGTKTLAFRLPKLEWLRNLLKKTGPLAAPSANWEGYPPAKTIKEAEKYFKNQVDFYLNGGKLESPPSTVIFVKDDKIKIIREGAAKIKKDDFK